MPEHAIASDEAGSDLTACAAYLIETISNLDAKGAATGALVGHYLANGDVDRAAETADALQDPFARDRLLIQVIGKCIDLKDDDYAFQLADAIVEPGLGSSALETAALRLGTRGEFEKALETASLLDHSSDTKAGIAVQQAVAGEVEGARKTVESIGYMKARVHARTEIASFERQQEKPETSREWLSKALEELPDIEFSEDRIRALNEIGNVYLDMGDHEQAIDCFGQAAEQAHVLDNVQKDGFLVASAIGILRCGDVELADATLDKVADKTQVAACLYGFSRVFEEDDKEDAAESAEEALAILKSQTDYDIRSTQARNEMFGAIAIQFQRVGMTARAVEIAHQNEDETQRNKALTAIAQLLVMAGKTEEADTTINGIEPESERVFACVALSDAANTVGNKELAVDYLKTASQLCVEVEQHIARARISEEIALRLYEYGATEEAISLARKSLTLVSEIRDNGGLATGLISLGGVYKKFGIEPDDDDKSILRTITRKSDW